MRHYPAAMLARVVEQRLSFKGRKTAFRAQPTAPCAYSILARTNEDRNREVPHRERLSQTAPSTHKTRPNGPGLTCEFDGGRCWVRTNVGYADGFTGGSQARLRKALDLHEPVLTPVGLFAQPLFNRNWGPQVQLCPAGADGPGNRHRFLRLASSAPGYPGGRLNCADANSRATRQSSAVTFCRRRR